MKLILLIDDNEQIRVTFGLVLRAKGYRVIEADSGEKGLALAREQMPDLILTDVNMPGGNGQELLQAIRADPELCAKQVVLMTGRPDLISPRKAMEDGADDFLVKPVKRDALLSCMEARLNRSEIHWRVENRVLAKMRESMNTFLPHEFFTPLAGIIGLSDIIKTEIATLSPFEIQDLNNGIRESAQRLHRTLRNYLLILEDPDGATPYDPPADGLAPQKLQAGFKTGIDSVVERLGRREDLVVECVASPILVSESDLAMIVEELVDNAVKFSRRGTAVDVRLTGEGILTVTDSGRGMTVGETSQIGAFQQMERKKYEQQGLGLGLCLVQKLAARNGATFSIASNEGKGVRTEVAFRNCAL